MAEGRTVTPNSEVLRKLRLAQGWRVEDLAEEAHCSAKTIENMERGKPVYICTLQACADALKVNPEMLLAGGRDKRGISVEVQIRLAIPFELFDQSEQLISLIKTLSKIIGGEIVVNSIKAGSVIIMLGMLPDDAQKLLGAFIKGGLPPEIIGVTVDVDLHPTAKELCEIRAAKREEEVKRSGELQQAKPQ